MGPDSANGGDGGRGSDGETGTGTGGQSGQSGQEDSLQQKEPSTVEKAVMVVSITFTLLLFAFAGWQMATAPSDDAEPKVSVVGTDLMENGSVAVRVRLRNPQDVGHVSATVSSTCTFPPTVVEFSYIPAASERTGTLVCPPGTSDPSVSMTSWVGR